MSNFFAAKAPVAGQVKTRLAAAIGAEAAATLYATFLTDLTTRFKHAPFRVSWYVAPAPWPGLEASRVEIQRGHGWAERQANFFRSRAAEGEGPVVLAATDSPQLEPDRVAEALEALRTQDLVFGPTFDGGYYLVGMSSFHDVFTGVAMSTASALDECLRRARRRGLSWALLPREFDVDTPADLALLAREAARRIDLPATSAALQRLLAPVP